MTQMDSPQPAALKRSRLFGQQDFAPWTHAETLTSAHLFWLPVSGFPLRHNERVWLLQFLTCFSDLLQAKHALRCEAFVDFQQLSPEPSRALRSYVARNQALLGFFRSSDTDDSPLLTDEQAQQSLQQISAAEEISMPTNKRLLWFLNRRLGEQLDLFFGHGGVSLAYMPPDPKTVPPPLPFTPELRASHPAFQRQDVDGMIQAVYAERDAFLGKSKLLFGKHMQDKAEWENTRFILPRFSSKQFFEASDALRNKWFSLAPVYLSESEEDKGILLCFQKSAYLVALRETIQTMNHRGLSYTSRTGA
jgi:hypothetical protein